MVYVDELWNYGWKYGKSCHMFADTDDELHVMASKIGCSRSWHQQPAPRPDCKSFSHYDLVVSKHQLAIAHGAKQLTMREARNKWVELGYLRKAQVSDE